MASKFVPRTVFNVSQDIPRTYFLGHHKTTLEEMKKMLSGIDAVIECRDFRIPRTSVNPLFEEALSGKKRLIVYTKRDKGGDRKLRMQGVEKLITRWSGDTVVFNEDMRRKTMVPFLKFLKKQQWGDPNPFTGLRLMVVGLPNVGKSSLINGLRSALVPIGKNAPAKAAKTGAEPGITRKIGGPVKLMDRKKGPVYLIDTPGVFLPHVPDAESMVRLALCGIVKESIISRTTLADYILYHTNHIKPYWYRKFCEPTNDVDTFLRNVALKSACLGPGGVPDLERACGRVMQLYDNGTAPGFMMDDTTIMFEELKARRQEEKAKKLAKKEAESQAQREEEEDQKGEDAEEEGEEGEVEQTEGPEAERSGG